ncbi:hypothetical protein [Aquibium oceanicum]|nr:hypothetical protein [Aquibium oceanicum]
MAIAIKGNLDFGLLATHHPSVSSSAERELQPAPQPSLSGVYRKYSKGE